jgi:hypothetical protein
VKTGSNYVPRLVQATHALRANYSTCLFSAHTSSIRHLKYEELTSNNTSHYVVLHSGSVFFYENQFLVHFGQILCLRGSLEIHLPYFQDVQIIFF